MINALIDSKKQSAYWRIKIETAWQKTDASPIEIGTLVDKAKSELGISYNSLQNELPFSSTVAAFLVKIAKHPILSNPEYYPKLPKSYNTLYHLAGVEGTQLLRRIEAGEIDPNYSVSQAKLLRAFAPAPNVAKNKPSKKVKR